MHETAEKLLSVHSELSLVLLQVTFLKGSKIVSLIYNKTSIMVERRMISTYVCTALRPAAFIFDSLSCQ